MIDVTFTFNGFNFAPYLSTYEVKYSLEEADSMVAMDGTEYVAIRKRPVIEFSLIPLTDAQSAAIYSALSVQTAPVTYTDPNMGRDATAVMRLASDINRVFGLRSVDGNRYYKGGTITLRQRTVF